MTRVGRLLLLCGLLAAIPGLGPERAEAADVRMGNVLPGGGLINRQVTSMTERRFEHLVQQHTDYSCGAASAATILKFAYGIDTDEEKVVRGMLKVADPKLVRKRGFSLLDIKRYVEKLGMRGRGYRVEAEQLREVTIPTIVLLNIRGYKHFVVLKKVEGDQVYIGDPILGNKIMDIQEFADGWNGIVFAVIGRGYDRETILRRPQPPVTARALHDVYSPVTDAELMGMGFRRSELF